MLINSSQVKQFRYWNDAKQACSSTIRKSYLYIKFWKKIVILYPIVVRNKRKYEKI